MIEINLLPGKKSKGVAVVAGMDMSLINVKMLVPAILLVFFVEGVIDLFYEDSIASVRKHDQELNDEIRRVGNELRSYNDIKEQVIILDKQQENLQSKIEVVKKIVQRRQNPFPILKYIANNTPENVWIKELEIKGKKITLHGHSRSWKSIARMIENLKDAIFFSGSINYNKEYSKQPNTTVPDLETFVIDTEIVSYN